MLAHDVVRSGAYSAVRGVLLLMRSLIQSQIPHQHMGMKWRTLEHDVDAALDTDALQYHAYVSSVSGTE